MTELQSLEGLGLILPGPGYIFGAILFGCIGYGAYRYGKKRERASIKWLGVALLLYPYAISETWLLYGVGSALCIAVIVLGKHA
jgi:hypothetical protein